MSSVTEDNYTTSSIALGDKRPEAHLAARMEMSAMVSKRRENVEVN
jgi:hypothetical protein